VTGRQTELSAQRVDVRLGRAVVLKGVSVALRSGERAAVVGPNGAGKSTLLRALAGLVSVESGSVVVDGHDLTALSRRDIAKRIAFMPQRPGSLFPMSCLDAVLLGRSPHKTGLGLADAGDIEAALARMEALSVGHLADRSITAVSGGELQRLMFARVLLQDTGFQLLDEPTSAQDPLGTLTFRQLLESESEKGVGCLVAVHDLNFALRGFERLLVISNGVVIIDATPSEVLDSGALEDAFGVSLTRVPYGDVPLVIANLPAQGG
jgi:iron complex transport system ATP-binding protein